MTSLPPPPRPSSLPPCIGREAELSTLKALYAEAAERGERLAILEGPTGVGKGRVLRELKTRMRLDGGVVLEGHSEPGRAFGPFADIVTEALRFLDEVGREPRADLEALACSQGCHRYWWQHSSTVPGLSLSSLSEDPQISALEKRLRFFDAIRQLLWQVAEVRPPVVMIHELDRADRGTLALLHFLLEEGRGPWTENVAPERTLRALFVACLRTDVEAPLGDLVASLRRLRSTRRVEIGRLDDDGVRAYLQSPETIQRVIERTGGMPEAIDLLLEGDPLTPEARVEKTLSQLSPEARSLIDALSVLDGSADADLLAHMAGRSVDAHARSEFARCELITRQVTEGTLLFAFLTQRDREQTYKLVHADRRRAIHARACDHFADHPGALATAARHALHARDYERAIELAMQAAQTLAASHDHAEAAALLESVLERSPEPSAEVRESLAELYRTAGDYARALAHAREAAKESPDSARAARREGQLLTLSGRLDEAAEALERARRLAEASNDAVAVTEADTLLAELHYQRGAYDDAESWARLGLEGARVHESLPLEIHARNTLGRLALMRGNPTESLALFEENFESAIDAGLAHQEAQALTNMGVARLHMRDLGGAQLDFERALNVSGASDTRDHAIALENLAVLAHWQRDFKTAQTRYYDAVTLLKRLGNREMLARVVNNLGELYCAVGDAARARTLCEFSSQVGGAGLSARVIAEGLLLRGRIEAAEGDLRAARAAFMAAREQFAGIRDARQSIACRELARLSLAEGDVPGASDWLAEITVGDAPKDASEHALVSAEIERAAGREPLPLARRAVVLAEDAGDPLALLPALLALARAQIDAGELSAATRALERAHTTETSLTQRVPEEGMPAWCERPLRTELARVEAQLATAWAKVDQQGGNPKARISSLPPSPRAERRKPEWEQRYSDIVGHSPALTTVLGVLDKVAPSDAMVLIRGESGTGKELIASAIHAQSPRRDKPLVKVNCAALVETLLLSELFGHEKGAFTGAQARKKGRFELADGGSIFLDEIGDISPKTQVALLRVLQEHEFERVGGTHPIKVDVRIIAATHRDLEQMVRDGTFREDLYYRLRGVMVRMPALRERLEDLPELCRDLLARIAEERNEAPKVLSDDALKLLRAHPWPGNVRELENVLRSVTLFAESPMLTAQDFGSLLESLSDPLHAGAAHDDSAAGAPVEDAVYNLIKAGNHSLLDLKKLIERECIARALRETDGNITKAATLLGMKRPRLSQLVKQYELGTDNGEVSA